MINIIAVDDEPLALQLVIAYVERTPGLNLLAKFENPLEAIAFIPGSGVDLVFIDIQMPGLSGIEFTRSMLKGPKVIFTTAFEKYAFEGFKLDVVDYLLKPFSYEEFLRAVQKAERSILRENKIPGKVESNAEFLFIRSDYKIRRINFNDILYIEGLKEYIKIYTQNEPLPVLSLSSLKLLETKLPQEKFLRVHRSFIVNLHKIDTIARSRIIFGSTYIPVGDQ